MANEDLSAGDEVFDGAPTIDALGAKRFAPVSSGSRTIGDPDVDFIAFANEERYEAKRQLGVGGMGEVRLCRDRVIGREVAMKVVLASHAGREEVSDRFVREARVQGQLEHPAIVPVYDFGRDAQHRLFFTMRCIRGITLEEILDRLRGGDSTAQRLHTRHKLLAVFVRVCLAIEFAHDHGVLHRDLKPSNVMLGRHGEVYVLDWGLAKVRSASKALDSRLHPPCSGDDPRPTPSPSERHEISGAGGSTTAHGSVLGTPQYMAPEQIAGAVIDARTDIYALGAILFEILTYEPLQGSGTITAILERAVKGVDARASVRAPHREVPPELERACVQATALLREDRYAHARELADAVESYLSGDRDIEMRLELAKVHLQRARDAADRAESAVSPSLSDRSTALQEVGRALALAPNDRDALAMFVGFLTHPPRTPPREVVEAVDRSTRESQRRMLPKAALAYATPAALFIPLGIAFVGGEIWLALLPLGLWLLAAVLALLTWRFGRPETEVFPVVSLTSALALAATSIFFGPFLLVPAIGAVMAMGMTLQGPRRTRGLLLGLVLMVVVGASVLALMDLHPVHHAFVDGGLVISGGAVFFSRPALALLALMHVVFIVVGARYVAAYRDTVRALQTNAQLQAWQLEQLVPSEATHAIEPALPRKR